MASQMTQINFRIDESVKEGAEQVLNELGLSLSAAITVYLKKVARERRIPFELSVDPFYSETNMRHLERIAQDVNSGRAHFSAHDLIEVD